MVRLLVYTWFGIEVDWPAKMTSDSITFLIEERVVLAADIFGAYASCQRNQQGQLSFNSGIILLDPRSASGGNVRRSDLD